MDNSKAIDEALKRLHEYGIIVTAKKRMGNDKGWRVECGNGAIVNVYENGTVVVQGKSKEEMEKALGLGNNKEGAKTILKKQEQNVFVVYGHDKALKDELEAMLRRWGLNPSILNQLPSGASTIIEKLEKYASVDVKFGIVLATPDDEGKKANSDEKPRPRVRQNIVLELGMLLSKLGRKKVAILLKEVDEMEKPSDISGLIYFPFSKSLEEIRADLAKEMNAQGITIDLANL